MDRTVRAASILLAAVGIILFALNIYFEGRLNIALPLVFLMLGGIFLIVGIGTQQQRPWTAALFIPAAMLLAFGVIFLLNVLTGDWNAWAYAWLLLVAGLGAGAVAANRRLAWHPLVEPIGWGLALGGITFFALFGAIAGGLLIQIIAPILLILGGISLRWLRPGFLFGRSADAAVPAISAAPASASSDLVEPISARELEVLRLLDDGLSNQQIAAKLNIANSTVKTHINNIYGKLGVQTRVQAIHRAHELGLLRP